MHALWRYISVVPLPLPVVQVILLCGSEVLLVSTDGRLNAAVCDGRRVGVCAAGTVCASGRRPLDHAALQRQHRLQNADSTRAPVLQNDAARNEGIYASVPRYCHIVMFDQIICFFIA